MITLRITNESKNSILATHAQVAITPSMRRNGLIGVTSGEFQPGAGLLFHECNAVHTVQMSMNIDIVFIDMITARVKKAVSRAEPGCHFNVLTPVPICTVLELPEGVIELTGTQAGDVISIMSSSHCSQEDLNAVGSMVWPHRP